MSESPELFTVAEDGQKVNIYNVPIFCAHADRGYHCDQEWLDRCVADFYAQKAESVRQYGAREAHAMCPPITIGHTPENPSDPEPPSIGFVDNLRRLGDTLYADFMGITQDDWEELKKNRYPYRSAEVMPKYHRLTNVSLLGGRYPHFPLPVMRFTALIQGEETEVVRYSMKGAYMPPQTQRHDMGTAQGGNTSGAGATAPAQINIDDLVNRCVEACMAKMGNNTANAGGGPQAAAYRAQGAVQRHEGAQVTAGVDGEEGKTKTDADEQANMVPPKADKNLLATARGVAKKYGISLKQAYAMVADIDKHGPQGAAKRAMWAQVSAAGDSEHRDENNDYEDMDGEWASGGGKKKHADTAEIQRHQAEIAALRGEIGEIQQHRADEQKAMKKTMLTQKFQTLVAGGHAIGDSAVIERHVSRCMKFSIDEIEQYIADLKANSPRVKVGQRYGAQEGVIRDPSGGTNRNALEGLEDTDVKRYGLDEDVARLADLLPGM